MHFKVYKRRVKDKIYGKIDDTAVGAQVQEMTDARMGAMYMLAKTDFHKVYSGTHLFENFVVGTEMFSDAKSMATSILDKTGATKAASKAAHKAKSFIESSDAGKKLFETVAIVGETTAAVIQKIKDYIADFFRGLLQKAKATYGDILDEVTWFSEFASWLVSEFAGNLSSLIPGWGYVQAASDLYSGVKQSIFKSKDLITQIYTGWGVQLLGGHPSVIANALARHSAKGLAGGLKSVAMTTAGIALEAAGDAAAGVGSLISTLTGILGRIVGLVDNLIQRALLSRVLKKARKEWDNRGSARAMVNNHKQFSEWFRNAVVTTPVVAALVMGSGFVAHPTKFMQLLNADGAAISQGDFDKGVTYIEKLKEISASYVQEYSDGYSLEFTSEDKLIAARLSELNTGQGILHGEEFVVKPTISMGLAVMATRMSALASPAHTDSFTRAKKQSA